jgi:8-oxo-dGTP diphosphatase
LEQTEKHYQNTLDLYFRGAFSVDIVLITYHDKKLKILLQEKKTFPFNGQLGLPGDLILPNEDIDKALEKLMKSIVGRCDFYNKQLSTFSDLGRHPLGRVVTFAYYGLVPYDQLEHSLSNELCWCEISKIPDLIIDHNRILNNVLKRLRKGLLRHPVAFYTLSKQFILSEIIGVYEQAFNQKLDVRNFRKKLLASGLVKRVGQFRKIEKAAGRPPELYEMNTIKTNTKDRIHFDFLKTDSE